MGLGVNVNFSIRPGMRLDRWHRGPIPTRSKCFGGLPDEYDHDQIRCASPELFTKPHLPNDPVKLPGTWPTNLMPTQIPAFVFQLPGNPGFVAYGNPGPQESSFDPRQNTLVVPYFSIIQ